MRIGIFGGTFDPPHLGHLILATEAQFSMSLDRVLWVLTSVPPHKTERQITSLEHRLEMVAACLAEDPTFDLSRVDIDRPGPHYAVDTVRILQNNYPGDELIYLMGGDSLRDLPTWYHPLEFVGACHALGVMRRPDERFHLSKLEIALPGITAKIRFIDAPLLEISSRQIRERITHNQPFRYYLHPAVYQIIQRDQLYRN